MESTEDAARSIRELSDPKLQQAAIIFVRALAGVDAAQWPIASAQGIGGKPCSRPPGRAMFAANRKALIRLADEADKQLGYVTNVLDRLSRAASDTESVGGVDVRAIRIEQHLVGKAGG